MTASRKPTTVRRTKFDAKELKDLWFDESAKGLEIFRRRNDPKLGVVYGPRIRIPWSQVMRSAARRIPATKKARAND